MGQHAVGLSYLRNALKWDPKSFEANIAYSSVAGWTGQHEESLTHIQRAIDTRPEDPDGYVFLGLALKGLKRFSEAGDAFRSALRLDPTHVGAAQNLAASLQEANRDVEAIAAWIAVTELDPNNSTAWFCRAQLHLKLGEFPQAIAGGRNVVRLKPNWSQGELLLALSLSESGQSEEAETHIRKAIDLDPNNGLALAALGFWLQEEGDFTKSSEVLERAVKLIPTHGFAYYNLYRSKKATPDDANQLAGMTELVSSGKLLPQDAAYMNYALGKACEDLHQYEHAITYFDEANKLAFNNWLAHRPWDKEQYSREFDSTIDFFGAKQFEALRSVGNESKSPILIVGMMRSGTSLVEQILSAHPDVTGGGELTFWHEHSEAIFDGLSLSTEALGCAATDYLMKLREIGNGRKHVTDKLPHNYALLGLIHAALPNAKIIHVSRNPIDNCLSIYTTAYQRPPVFAHNRDNIVFAYREYQRLMAHWRKVIPASSLLEVRYEDLISDRSRVTQQMIEFSGLDWDESCLHHEANTRVVRTPSLWQVRQPIYKTSVERWKKFEPWIAPFDTLAD